MKISKFILTILITISLFAVSTNKASAFSDDREQSERRSDDDNKGGGGACLPINSQAWFLLIAGLAIGTKVLTRKKALKLQKVAYRG